MENYISYIVELAQVDERLEELLQDYGELPEQLKRLEANYKQKKSVCEETETIYNEVKKNCSETKIRLVELKDKEEKLAKEQFLVRNNKEFDAISNELKYIKELHEKLSNQLRSDGVKEENLKRILDDQKTEMAASKAEFENKYTEIKSLAGEQKDELNDLQENRQKLFDHLPSRTAADYERIRTMHKDAAVAIKRNSCSGCFSAVPAQLIVNIRNNYNITYTCESCGRILFPDDMAF